MKKTTYIIRKTKRIAKPDAQAMAALQAMYRQSFEQETNLREVFWGWLTDYVAERHIPELVVNDTIDKVMMILSSSAAGEECARVWDSLTSEHKEMVELIFKQGEHRMEKLEGEYLATQQAVLAFMEVHPNVFKTNEVMDFVEQILKNPDTKDDTVRVLKGRYAKPVGGGYEDSVKLNPAGLIQLLSFSHHRFFNDEMTHEEIYSALGVQGSTAYLSLPRKKLSATVRRILDANSTR